MRLLLCFLIAASCDGPRTAQPETAETEASSASEGNDSTLELPTPEAFARTHDRFDSYWYQGVAELSRYELTQSRYGDTHEGEAVLIFVTEPFLPDAQVKHESGDHESVSVLKINHYRRFYTGIYPYTVMTSAFQPVSGEAALKVATSVQEWCGHAFTQLNRREGAVQATSHSYFQAEGDQTDTLDDVPFEDALWSQIRRDPRAIPTGAQQMIPALYWIRFKHRPLAAYDAEVSLTEGDHLTLEVRYPALGRTLRIHAQTNFPHAIDRWEEEDAEGTTRARRTRAILTDYWSHNGAADGAYREALGVH
ncbi:MAG: septum formation inhibitor Maf [Myxococcota bacterium]